MFVQMPTNFTRETEAFVREVCQDPKYLVNSEEASSSCMSDFTWLPFRLVLQALFFFAPVCIWKRNYDAPGKQVVGSNIETMVCL